MEWNAINIHEYIHIYCHHIFQLQRSSIFLYMQQLNFYKQQIKEVYLDVGFWRKTNKAPYSFLFFHIESSLKFCFPRLQKPYFVSLLSAVVRLTSLQRVDNIPNLDWDESL